MKKILSIIIILFVLSCIFFVGLHKRNQKEIDDFKVTNDADSQMTNTDDSESFTDDEKNYFNQLQKDSEAAEKRNIYMIDDGRQSFGGLGYEVKSFQVFDSMGAFKASEKYVDDYLEFEPAGTDFAEIVYVEYELTNEGQSKVTFYPHNLNVVYTNEKGFTYDDKKGMGSNGAIRGMFNEVFYSSKVKNPVDDKNPNAPIVESGETISLQVAFVCIGGDSEEEVEMKPSDLYHPGYWYFAIPGVGINSSDDYNINEDNTHIFIKLE